MGRRCGRGLRRTRSKVPVCRDSGRRDLRGTLGLARAGLLDDRRHTSAAPEYLATSGYRGGDLYVDTRAVIDDAGLLITAGPDSPVHFARATLASLGLASEQILAAYESVFHRGDASCFPTLMQTVTAGRAS